MKHFYLLILILFFYSLPGVLESAFYPKPKDVAVMLSAEYTEVTNSGVELKWKKRKADSLYKIYRRADTKTLWQLKNTLQASQYEENELVKYLDSEAGKNTAYEYQIEAIFKADVQGEDQQGNKVDIPVDYYAYGYALAGKEIPEPEINKAVLLLIDSSQVEALRFELDQLKADLLAEGWFVRERLAPRAEEFDKEKVMATKKIVLEEYEDPSYDLTSIFIIGRVPVPYSGRINPDAHPDHIGAWPADAYYGEMQNDWSDILVNVANDQRPNQKNIPNDGKFDNSTIPTDLDVAVGRVDFYNLSFFHNSKTNPKSETELLKQYLQRDHDYRNGNMNIIRRGLIADKFGAYGGHQFAASGWRNFSVLFGEDSVSTGDLFAKMANDNYLWAYGCGGGSYTSMGSVDSTVKSIHFSEKPYNGVFNMLFGSYFGNWDNSNNLLRSSLASEPAALAVMWAGRPPWFVHHMGMGYSMGYAAKLSANNLDEGYNTIYKNGLFVHNNTAYPHWYALKFVHIALLGDPTLTLYPGSVIVPEDITIVQQELNTVKISWALPESSNIIGVNVFRSSAPEGPFIKVNQELIHSSAYIDTVEMEKGIDKNYYYMIRSVAVQETNTGSFLRMSRGEVKEMLVSDVEEGTLAGFSVEAYPNPATVKANINVTLDIAGNTSLEIYDIKGNLIKRFPEMQLISGGHNFEWDLKDNYGSRVSPGVYMLKLTTNGKQKVNKIIVH